MKKLKEERIKISFKVRPCFSIALAVAIGIGLARFSIALYCYYCSGENAPLIWGDNPPWTLLSAIAAAPALVLTWYWRKIYRDAEINEKKEENRIRQEELNQRDVESSKRDVDFQKQNQKQMEAREAELQVEKISKAIEQLGHDRIAVRLGGINALEMLGHRYPDERNVIVKTLSMFVREKLLKPATEEQKILPTDIMASLQVLKELEGTSFLDLSETYCQRLDLSGVCFQKANLKGAHLQGTKFQKANLQGANLQGANLQEANLREADLMLANLEGADLTKAMLLYANLGGANFAGANLDNADIRTNLEGANLAGANVQKAHFGGANLKGANLEDTNLAEAINLEGTKCDSKTVLPDGYICDDGFIKKAEK